uniref:DNA2/NAM7 helicase-like C-terminal domain-containing protein n=1 Tax=Chromera velia CCMP2878 TaxID=1169474 RepID=A0A0G4HFQ8_9ALVE|eukprot:Cvel_6632.t1-p1 / transcript=Cvel_6632.t1 / gene=Cvel_6632 / organism=Chromera_velia_CCMP2878 / gene_product=hypothetical protein / transcript_product=hypothetical protein / location=Cvel_scaffold328:81583-82758(-) / protein_length=188 / sequence_SO=supercontig / SO=protein_coding / is_pseudo=false
MLPCLVPTLCASNESIVFLANDPARAPVQWRQRPRQPAYRVGWGVPACPLPEAREGADFYLRPRQTGGWEHPPGRNEVRKLRCRQWTLSRVLVLSCVRSFFPPGPSSSSSVFFGEGIGEQAGEIREKESTLSLSGSDVFCGCPKRLNVAFSRARRHLVVIASRAFLEGSPLWREMLSHAHREGTVIRQ